MKFQPFLGWRPASTTHYNKIIMGANFPICKGLRASSELSLYPLPAGACAGSPGKWRAGKQGGGSSRAPGKHLGSHAGGQVAGGAGRDSASTETHTDRLGEDFG
jgi:hypothetical protein